MLKIDFNKPVKKFRDFRKLIIVYNLQKKLKFKKGER